MYRNKCTKCGAEFETKNPKRVICPACLYPDRKDLSLESYKQPASEPVQPPQGKEDPNFKQKAPGYYVAKDTQQTQPDRGSQDRGYQDRGYPNRNYQDRGYQQDRNYGPPRPQRPSGNFGGGSPGGSGFRRPQPAQPYNQQRPMGGAPGGGGFRRPPFQQQGRPPFQGGQRDNRMGPRRPPAADKKLLISREQVAEIEKLYMAMLPLPNPDCHEVIGEKIGLEGNKVFFGINLVRQKMRLPKLPYPKRKLAISPDQLTAIKNLYSPLLPLPPIGCHKFLAKQLKMDEWRVHVGIGIIRKQMSLPRWNTERDDAPAEFKTQTPPQTSQDKE